MKLLLFGKRVTVLNLEQRLFNCLLKNLPEMYLVYFNEETRKKEMAQVKNFSIIVED